MILTASQTAAIHHGDSNLQLIACAGSGKTEVIARRVAHLLKSGYKPANIIAFTFTEKAAAELKERIVSRCREELGEIHGMAEMYIGTVHAFCLDLLAAEVPKYLKFDVLNEVQQALFIDRYSNQSGLTASTENSGGQATMKFVIVSERKSVRVHGGGKMEMSDLVRYWMQHLRLGYRVVLTLGGYVSRVGPS